MSNIQKRSQTVVKSDLQKRLQKLMELEETSREIVSQSELPRMFQQYIIFVLDASRSMRQPSVNQNSKAHEVHIAIESVLNRLMKSKNVNSFDIGLWCFSDKNYPIFKLKPVKELKGANFNPVILVNEPGDTYLNPTLEDIEHEIKKYCNENFTKNHQVLILLLTDGALDDREPSLTTIKRIKRNANVTISAIHFQKFIDQNSQYYSWDEKTGQIDYTKPWTIEQVKDNEERIGERFREFASSETFFVNTLNPDEIRNHMIKSVSATSKLDY